MASDADAVRATLKAWLDALARNDVPAVERIIADDYVITARPASWGHTFAP
jgi:ketosteroid isomerase-like protein